MHQFIDPKKLKKNRGKNYKSYNQGKTPYCTVYASAGAHAWNNGKVLSDETVYKLAKRWLGDSGNNTVRMGYKFAKRYRQQAFTIPLHDIKAVVDRGWAVLIGVKFDKSVFTDGRDGIIDGKYKNQLMDMFKKKDGKGGHAMYIIKNRLSYYLCNSWGNDSNKYNMFKINIDKWIESGTARTYGVLIVEKNITKR